MTQVKKYWVDKATGKYLTKNIEGQDHLLYKWVEEEPEIVYGALYNWYVGTDERNIAPEGWHIPSNEEYLELREYLDPNNLGFGGTETNNAGGKLKSEGFEYWDTPNTGATNETGFNARAVGRRTSLGFIDFKEKNYFWNSYNNSESQGGMSVLMHDSAVFSAWLYKYTGKITGMSIRFIKDDSNDTGTVNGNDGTVYKTVKIGEQVWVAENIIETKYRNGDEIPIVEDDTDWSNLTTGAMCYYNNDVNNAYV